MAIVGGSGKCTVADAAGCVGDESDAWGNTGGNLDEYQEDIGMECGGCSRDRNDLYRPIQ